ncbi:MFS transporter [Streptomyces flavidovirens]|uniref:MFS transporter n=1 Tax=Streptomyces flavidovirens TaxID=67298 RepID=UPI0033B6D15C
MRERGGERHWSVFAAIGAAIIAVCYGFARYAYGLFEPTFREVFSLSGAGLGLLGGLATTGYALGLLLGPVVSGRSPRGTVLASGALAAGGVATVAVAQRVPVLAVGAVLAASSAGLASTGVAQLISRRVAGAGHRSAQTWANTGTSFGLVLSALTPLISVSWRWSWASFAVIAALATAVTWLVLPARRDAGQHEPEGFAVSAGGGRGPAWRDADVRRLVASSLVLGATSAPYWNFSQGRLVEAGLAGVPAAVCWCVIGVAGPLGGLTGRLTEAAGPRRAAVILWLPWSLSLALPALPGPALPVALVSAALFGAAYMGLSGLFILWAVDLFPRASQGVTVSFLALAAGQAAAAPVAGLLGDRVGLGPVFGLAAVGGLAGLVLLPRHRREPGLTSAPLPSSRAW